MGLCDYKFLHTDRAMAGQEPDYPKRHRFRRDAAPGGAHMRHAAVNLHHSSRWLICRLLHQHACSVLHTEHGRTIAKGYTASWRLRYWLRYAGQGRGRRLYIQVNKLNALNMLAS